MLELHSLPVAGDVKLNPIGLPDEGIEAAD